MFRQLDIGDLDALEIIKNLDIGYLDALVLLANNLDLPKEAQQEVLVSSPPAT